MLLPETPPQARKSVSTSANGQPSDGELAEDMMDMSRSDFDEGEITEYDPESPVLQQPEADLTENEDIYEPPPIMETKPAMLPEADVRNEPFQVSESTVQDPSVADIHNTVHGRQGSTYRMSNTPHGRLPATIVDDSDDYEPPEPVSPNEEIPPGTHQDTVEPYSTHIMASTHQDAYPIDQSQATSPDMKSAPELSIEGAGPESKQMVRLIPTACQYTDEVGRHLRDLTSALTTSPRMKAR